MPAFFVVLVLLPGCRDWEQMQESCAVARGERACRQLSGPSGPSPASPGAAQAAGGGHSRIAAALLTACRPNTRYLVVSVGA